mmetsp:Transcript_101787/g.233067  ORF Transcript_101787/g.233067 Transcript_101787/m.233067 type:complete len:81 (-) Transcript_101787:233-475(-)
MHMSLVPLADRAFAPRESKSQQPPQLQLDPTRFPGYFPLSPGILPMVAGGGACSRGGCCAVRFRRGGWLRQHPVLRTPVG